MVVPSWEYGVLFGFLGSIVASASKLAIRKSWLLLLQQNDNDEPATPPPHRAAAALALRWCGLLALSVVGPVLDLLALSHANPSLLAPFAGLSLAWIVLCSELLTGERPSPHQVRASALVGVGLLLTTMCGDHSNPNEHATVDDLRASYRDPLFLSFLGAVGVWMALLCYFILQSENAALQRLAWGVSGGSIGGLRNFLKDGLTILHHRQVSSSSSDDNIHQPQHSSRWWNVILSLPLFWYGLALMAIATAVTNLTCQTFCMKRYDATFANAMTAGSFVISTTLMSAIHYPSTFRATTTTTTTYDGLVVVVVVVLYAVGLALILGGLWILMAGPTTAKDVTAATAAAAAAALVVIDNNDDDDNVDDHDTERQRFLQSRNTVERYGSTG